MLQAATTSATALTSEDFKHVASLAYRHAGLVVREEKAVMVGGRLARRATALGLADLGAYCRLLRSGEAEDELPFLINALTTNHTSFFRERHHFDHLAATVLPTLAERAQRTDGVVRFWSAACSTGEEPYSIAAVIRATLGRGALPGLRVLATDIDTEVLAIAGRARYATQGFDGAPAAWVDALSGKSKVADGFNVVPDTKALVAFRHLNLIGPWPMKQGYDVIFCRNVFIYFDNPTKAKLVDRYAELLRPGGYLYLGHTEFLTGPHALLAPVGRTIYRRK